MIAILFFLALLLAIVYSIGHGQGYQEGQREALDPPPEPLGDWWSHY